MIMDVYLHTFLAMTAIGAAYYAGNYFSTANVENIVGAMLETLEKEGFVETSLDKDGDKELIPISELIANAVKESEKTT
jgi:hypothetical protein